MTRRADRDLAAKIKAKVALAALRGDKTLAELSAEFDLDPEQIAEWKKELERNAEAAFSESDIPSSEAPTLPNALAKAPALPTLPTARAQAAVPQSSTRLSAATLPTPPTVRDRPTVSQPPAASKAPAAPTPPTLEDAPTLPQWPSGPKSPTLPKPASERLDDDFWGEGTLQTSGVKTSLNVAARPTPPPPRRQPSSTWPRKLLAPLLVGWQEKHHAAKTSRELLKLYENVAAAHPGMKKQELYRFVVIARLGGTLAAADAVLARATESFATWPVERALTFRDVVHYLAVSDYLANNEDAAEWTRENLGRVVASLVPEHL